MTSADRGEAATAGRHRPDPWPAVSPGVPPPSPGLRRGSRTTHRGLPILGWRCRRSSVVEQLFCKQLAVSSNLTVGSLFDLRLVPPRYVQNRGVSTPWLSTWLSTLGAPGGHCGCQIWPLWLSAVAVTGAWGRASARGVGACVADRTALPTVEGHHVAASCGGGDASAVELVLGLPTGLVHPSGHGPSIRAG